MRAKRDDPLLLPICQACGKYKGVGICKNPDCSESIRKSDASVSSCDFCGRRKVLTCVQCGQSFCEGHGKGANLHRLEFFHQRVGTCIMCEQYVCEKCWILNPNGDIVCLRHLEEERKNQIISLDTTLNIT